MNEKKDEKFKTASRKERRGLMQKLGKVPGSGIQEIPFWELMEALEIHTWEYSPTREHSKKLHSRKIKNFIRNSLIVAGSAIVLTALYFAANYETSNYERLANYYPPKANSTFRDSILEDTLHYSIVPKPLKP